MRSDYHRSARRRFLKTSVIGFGFLSGLWAGFGIDPESIVASWLQNILLSAAPHYELWITLAFLYGPALLTLIGLVLIYQRAGFLGFVAVALAYAAGFLFSLTSIPLMLLALLIGWIAARRVR